MLTGDDVCRHFDDWEIFFSNQGKNSSRVQKTVHDEAREIQKFDKKEQKSSRPAFCQHI